MKLLAAHNTLTAYPVKGVNKVLNLGAQCQNKSVEHLYSLGVRVFDFRIRFDGNVIVAHGLCDYNVDFEEIMNTLQHLYDTYNDQIYIRLMNEDTYGDSDITAFAWYITLLLEKYPNFKWWIIDSKAKAKDHSHTVINQFPKGYKHISSYWTLGKFWFPPRLYSKLFNKKFKKEYNSIKKSDKVIYWMDFI